MIFANEIWGNYLRERRWGGGGYDGILRYFPVGSYVMSGRFFLKPALSNKCINTKIQIQAKMDWRNSVYNKNIFQYEIRELRC